MHATCEQAGRCCATGDDGLAAPFWLQDGSNLDFVPLSEDGGLQKAVIEEAPQPVGHDGPPPRGREGNEETAALALLDKALSS